MNITDKYDVFLFDLDGTLTDTGPGIRNSVAYALKQQGIDVGDMSELNKFIGPPLFDSFQSFYGMDDEQAAKAVADYRSVYAKKGIYENNIYDGMRELLKALFDMGKTLAVATSKPEKFAGLIVDDLQISQYFKLVAGADMEGKRNKKSVVIEYALDALNVIDKNKVLMIGDTRFDVIGAKECGVDCLGVLFGYGSRQELEDAGAAYICGDVPSIFML
ncbi:MAG: HAD family hydrolase [Clostridium sp.]|nr:HAD family hydrolase [Clostridium sp.]MCM1172193.1 HAD family hydrolase [Clostridium sp.]MCM1209771.1 HAD family hydrolase [Ruminococcus sp.]